MKILCCILFVLLYYIVISVYYNGMNLSNFIIGLSCGLIGVSSTSILKSISSTSLMFSLMILAKEQDPVISGVLILISIFIFFVEKGTENGRS